jgi:thiol-disulfide isomerase/thioredoxin
MCLATLLSVNLAFAQTEDEADDDDDSDVALPSFTIGSKAPDLDIEHWLSDGEGRFEHTRQLRSDTVYVVEFWATWCGPCIASMPHLSETQEKYADKGVQLISISDESLEKVEAFLEKPVRGNDEITYAELTKNYCLTTDPDKSVMNDYFRAAGQRGIPCAFIVGREGIVEWIGHPMRMDEPLQKVLEGEWDRAAFAETFIEQQRQQAIAMKLQRKLQSKIEEIRKAMESGETESGLNMVDELIADAKMKQFKPMLQNMRDQFAIMYVGGAEAAAALMKTANARKSDPNALNEMAWGLYERHKVKTLDKEVLDAATEIAEMAVKGEPENGAILDTLAHLVYEQGDLDRAIELQEKAVKFCDDDAMLVDLEKFLEKLKAEKNK